MKKLLLSILVILPALLAAGAVTLTASLPRRDGGVELSGLAAPVEIELDERAIPRIRAASLVDAFRAQGFVHAQERFFQMDLTRRDTAGELAALVGEAALPRDRGRRVFQYRKRARTLAEALPARERAWLDAYVEGVNAGLADLGSRPPEYWLLRARPEPWTIEDSLLVVFAFCTMLSENHRYERPQGVMRATLPDAVYDFLTPSTSRFDRPLGGGNPDPTGGYRPAPIPPAEAVGSLRPPPAGTPVVAPPAGGAASNQWAVGAARSAGAGAIVANDPHLDLSLPNVFHRAELYFDGRAARGLGIPGVPGIVVGATDAIAWGVTASYADQSDWVVVEVDAADPGAYRVASGKEGFRVEREAIAVRGRSEPEFLDVRLTRWGPVADRDWLGRPLALHATWLEPGGVNLDILGLMLADTVEDALDTLAGWAGPPLSFVLADTAGDAGWMVSGPLPARIGFDGSEPLSWADGRRGWRGVAALPRLVAPDGGVVFNANNRPLPAADSVALGRVWMRPFRAKRIADLLSGQPRFTEADFLAMQLDTRAEAFDRVREVALGALTAAEPDPLLAEVRRAIVDWNGRADASETGFRLLDLYYLALRERLLAPLLAPAREADPTFVYRWPLADEPMRRLLDERPTYLLPEGFADWDAYLRHVLVDVVRPLADDSVAEGVHATWGEVNRLDVGHPLARLPLLGRWLRLPPVPQPGSAVSLRVASPDRGAVMRMAVSPARPEDGILEMSGGQSGHFLSKHFRDQQREWVAGAPSPFLAGETVAAYTLRPIR